VISDDNFYYVSVKKH